jgi:hypothetical protein
MGHTLERFTAAADLLRPRTLLRSLSRVNSLVDATRELTTAVQALRIQTDQLMTIQRVDWEKRFEIERLDSMLDADTVRRHVTAAIDAAPLELDPFPHIVVNGWLPDSTYGRVIDAMPPAVFFANNRDEHWSVPSAVAPVYSRLVWAFVANRIVGDMLYDALNGKFAGVVRDYVGSFCPSLCDDVDLKLHPSDGRIMLRRPGYNLLPHRDPRWGFITGIAYLAREDDSEAHGTQLYRVREDHAAPSSRVYYVEQPRCELVKDVPFRANSLLVFLNSEGAHGASIPKDVSPDLERYIYQFRLGPTVKEINRLLQLMPPDKAAMWANAKTDRAARY